MKSGLFGIVILITMSLASPSEGQERTLITPLTDRTFHVSARGDIGFAAITAGLKVFDLSAPKENDPLALVPLPQSGTYVLNRDPLVLIAQGPAGVYAFDVETPSNPSVVCHFDTPGSAMMLGLRGDVLAVADGSMGVALFDVRDIRNPRSLGTPMWTGGYCRGLGFLGSALYACAGGSGLIVMEADGTGEWRTVGGCASAGDARAVAFHDSTAIVADGKEGVTLFDVSNPRDPRLIVTIPVADLAHGVAADGEFVYVADGAAGVGVYRWTGRAELECVARADTGKGYANSVTVHDGALLVANDHRGVLVLDITTPAKPRAPE